MPLFDAVHPGRILRNWMGSDITITRLADHIGATRPQISNILNGKAGVSASMAIKLAQAFPKTEPRFWVNLQSNYELSRALREAKPAAIGPLREDSAEPVSAAV